MRNMAATRMLKLPTVLTVQQVNRQLLVCRREQPSHSFSGGGHIKVDQVILQKDRTTAVLGDFATEVPVTQGVLCRVVVDCFSSSLSHSTVQLLT
jgi:hypothetical protein